MKMMKMNDYTNTEKFRMIKNISQSCDETDAYTEECIEAIRDVVTPKGKWIKNDSNALNGQPCEHFIQGKGIKNDSNALWHCSVCGQENEYAYVYDEYFGFNEKLQDFYCPHCGAKMIGEVKKNEQV